MVKNTSSRSAVFESVPENDLKKSFTISLLADRPK
jgi:hypothetical protein